MTLQEARKVLLDDSSTSGLWAQAAARIYEDTSEKDRLSQETLHFLLKCLQRPLAQATGVIGLYLWTNRPMPDDFMDNCRDPEEWLAYLKANKFD